MKVFVLASLATILTVGLAAMGAMAHGAQHKSEAACLRSPAIADCSTTVDEGEAGMVCRTDERAAAVNEVLSRMKSHSRSEIAARILSDTGDFLVALDGAIAEDRGETGGDLPLLYLIDKEHSVGRGYVPKELVPLDGKGSCTVSRNGLSLRSEAAAALERMAQAARKDGVTLMASSTYRSYDYQKTVYEKWVRLDGQEEADRESARPGTSQHQLGCAVDFGSITDDFADTAMGKWVYAHAADWGWSLSFPRGYEDVTGYRWECWHFRYIGREACRLQDEWFCGVQQYMMEFIDIYRSMIASDGRA